MKCLNTQAGDILHASKNSLQTVRYSLKRAARKIYGQYFKALALSLLHYVIHMWPESVFSSGYEMLYLH